MAGAEVAAQLRSAAATAVVPFGSRPVAAAAAVLVGPYAREPAAGSVMQEAACTVAQRLASAYKHFAVADVARCVAAADTRADRQRWWCKSVAADTAYPSRRAASALALLLAGEESNAVVASADASPSHALACANIGAAAEAAVAAAAAEAAEAARKIEDVVAVETGTAIAAPNYWQSDSCTVAGAESTAATVGHRNTEPATVTEKREKSQVTTHAHTHEAGNQSHSRLVYVPSGAVDAVVERVAAAVGDDVVVAAGAAAVAVVVGCDENVGVAAIDASVSASVVPVPGPGPAPTKTKRKTKALRQMQHHQMASQRYSKWTRRRRSTSTLR